MLEEFLNDPDLAIGVFSKLKEEREKVKQLESENKKLTKKSEYLDLTIRIHSHCDYSSPCDFEDLYFNSLCEKIRHAC
jgi:hypothetical protein